jgi:hypothetical protein
MNTLIRSMIAITRPFSQRLGPCELNGMLIGALTGFMFCIAWLMGEAFTPVAYPLWLYIALVLALFCWGALFALLCGPLRYAASTVAGPLLINALLTSTLTVYLCNLSGQPFLFFLIGMLVGLLVGRLLCRYCRKPTQRTKEG